MRWNHSMASGPLGAPRVPPPASPDQPTAPPPTHSDHLLRPPPRLYPTTRPPRRAHYTRREAVNQPPSLPGPLSPSRHPIQPRVSRPSLAAAPSNTAANTKHFDTADSKLAPGLKEERVGRGEKKTQNTTTTQTLTHRQCTTTEY